MLFPVQGDFQPDFLSHSDSMPQSVMWHITAGHSVGVLIQAGTSFICASDPAKFGGLAGLLFNTLSTSSFLAVKQPMLSILLPTWTPDLHSMAVRCRNNFTLFVYVNLWVYPDCMCKYNITFRTDSLYFLAQLFPTRLNLEQGWLKVMLAMVLGVSQISHYLKTLTSHPC